MKSLIRSLTDIGTGCLPLMICVASCLQVYAAQAAASPAQSAKEQTILNIQQFIIQNDIVAARSAMTEALKRYPGDSGLENLLGIIEAQSGNYTAAESAFTSAIKRAPGFVNAYLNLGRLYQEHTGDDPDALSKALKTYQQLLRNSPDHIEGAYQSAVLLQRMDNVKASMPYLENLPAEYRKEPNVLALFCAAYAATGQRARADQSVTSLSLHPGLSEQDVLFIIPALVKYERADLAMILLEELSSRGAAGSESSRQLGLLYERKGDLAKARMMLERTGTPTVPVLIDLARVAFQQKDYRAALGYLAHARDLEPGRAQIHYLFGETCIRLELIAEAHQAFLKAVELEPDEPSYNYAAGAAAAYFRDPSDAIPYFRKYLQLRPRDAQGRLLLGAVHFRNRDYIAARAELQQALSDKRTASSAHYYLGKMARLEGHMSQAFSELRQSLQIDPRNTAALAELGQCHLQKREYAEAEQALLKALAIDGDHYAANFNLLTLYSRTKDPRRTAQADRFEEVKRRRSEKEQDFLRAIETRPR